MEGGLLQNATCSTLPDWLYIHVAASTTLAPEGKWEVEEGDGGGTADDDASQTGT